MAIVQLRGCLIMNKKLVIILFFLQSIVSSVYAATTYVPLSQDQINELDVAAIRARLDGHANNLSLQELDWMRQRVTRFGDVAFIQEQEQGRNLWQATQIVESNAQARRQCFIEFDRLQGPARIRETQAREEAERQERQAAAARELTGRQNQWREDMDRLLAEVDEELTGGPGFLYSYAVEGRLGRMRNEGLNGSLESRLALTPERATEGTHLSNEEIVRRVRAIERLRINSGEGRAYAAVMDMLQREAQRRNLSLVKKDNRLIITLCVAAVILIGQQIYLKWQKIKKEREKKKAAAAALEQE
jgi:hypothetical protein